MAVNGDYGVVVCLSLFYTSVVLFTRPLLAWSLMLFPLGSAFALSVDDEEAQVLEHSCNDVVAVGRIQTLSYTDVTAESDILGRGRFSMRIVVKRVFRGHLPQRSVTAFRIAHGQLRSDRDFLVVLSPEEGGYTLKHATLWNDHTRPKVAAQCVG